MSYIPNTKQVFYCEHCDAAKVDSEQPETGSFFLQAGHAYNPVTKEYDGDYGRVMFALCTSCKAT